MYNDSIEKFFNLKHNLQILKGKAEKVWTSLFRFYKAVSKEAYKSVPTSEKRRSANKKRN